MAEDRVPLQIIRFSTLGKLGFPYFLEEHPEKRVIFFLRNCRLKNAVSSSEPHPMNEVPLQGVSYPPPVPPYLSTGINN